MVRTIRRALRDTAYSLLTATLGDAEGYVTLPTLRGPARGLRFRLDLRGRVESGYWLGYYDLDLLRAITRICRPGWTVWDCGVYLGYYTAFFARLVGPTGKVVAIEPDPNNLRRAQANVRLNRLHNVTFAPVAIGGPRGEVEFIVSANTNSHLPGMYIGASAVEYRPQEQAETLIKVRCISLDEAYTTEGLAAPNLVKLDIEGAEAESLQHVAALAEECRPLIVLELHNPECDAAAWQFAQRYKYSLRSLNTGQLINRAEAVGGTLLCTPQT